MVLGDNDKGKRFQWKWFIEEKDMKRVFDYILIYSFFIHFPRPLV